MPAKKKPASPASRLNKKATPAPAAPAKKAPAKPMAAKGMAAKPVAKVMPSREQISARAYQVWKAKGCIPGQDIQNWQEAERQLIAEMGGR